MDLVLIRHPAVDIAAGICYGRSDIPLRESASDGATAIKHKFDQLGIVPTRLCSSPLQRCVTVAHVLALQYDIPVTADGRLQELDFGRWEQCHWNNVPREELDAWAADTEHARLHGGESVAMLAKRLDSWLNEHLRQVEDGQTLKPSALAEEAGTTIVVTHAGVIRLLAARALALPILSCIDWPLDMTGICRLRRANATSRWTLAQWNR